MLESFYDVATVSLLWLHILSAIIGLGVAMLHPLLISHLHQHWPNPTVVGLFLFIEHWYITPAHSVMVISGFGLTLISGLSVTEIWLGMSIILMAAIIGIHRLAFLPLIRQLIQVESPHKILHRLKWVSRLAGLLSLTILTLMITQPGRH
jgi:hypothetical protein